MTCQWHVRAATDQGAARAANRVPPGAPKNKDRSLDRSLFFGLPRGENPSAARWTDKRKPDSFPCAGVRGTRGKASTTRVPPGAPQTESGRNSRIKPFFIAGLSLACKVPNRHSPFLPAARRAPRRSPADRAIKTFCFLLT